MNYLAQFSNIKVPTTGQGAIDINSASSGIGPIVGAVLPYIFGAVGLLLLIYLVLGGLQLMTSRGDPKAISAAQAKITNALIGFVIVLISAGLVVILGKILNVNVFSTLF